MSSGQTPRTPDNFPNMNDRAGRRRARRAVPPPTALAAVGTAMREFAEAVKAAAPAIRAGMRRVSEAMRAAARPRFAEGGEVKGTPRDLDSIPVMLSPGYVSYDDGETWHEQGTE